MKMIILRKVSQDADIKCIFGTTISGIKLAQIVKIFMHRASTMFYLHYRAVLNLHGRYVLLHFNEITHCYTVSVRILKSTACPVAHPGFHGALQLVSIPSLIVPR